MVPKESKERIKIFQREEYRYINQEEEAWFELQHDLECVDRNPEDFKEPYQEGRLEKCGFESLSSFIDSSSIQKF